jgi:hypothetical protein
MMVRLCCFNAPGSDKLVMNDAKQVCSSSAGMELLSAMRPDHPLTGVVLRAAQVESPDKDES